MDSLSSILNTFRLHVEITNNAQYCGNWGIDTSGEGYVSFHLVTHGVCYARSECLEEPVRLEAGDFIMFPKDSPHTIRSENSADVAINTAEPVGYEQGPRDDGVGLLCGYFQFTHSANNPLLDILPAVMVKQLKYAKTDCVASTLLKLIKKEALERDAGMQVAINRLTESLFIVLVREHITNHSAANGLSAALADSRISKALDKIHEQPDHNWTVEKLANIANMSRSSFADQFKSLLNESPMGYLTRWRMQNAWLWLKEEKASVYETAIRCGYESEASFAKAFKKVIGETPGKVRKGETAA